MISHKGGGIKRKGGDLERVGKSVRTVETEWEKVGKSVRRGGGGESKKCVVSYLNASFYKKCIAKMWLGGGQDVTRIWPGCGQDVVRM